MATFIAMNHFSVDPERATEFEEAWRERDTHLHEVPGIRGFALLKGEETGSYASHTVWESRAAFEAWTESEAFKQAHSQARLPKGVLLGHPRIMLWDAVLEE